MAVARYFNSSTPEKQNLDTIGLDSDTQAPKIATRASNSQGLSVEQTCSIRREATTGRTE
ncbi:putative succinate-semialdehyde dehydrogenase [NADP(+)] [Venturia inaequalis]|nr:putative succinate-semialdehyde dehydrogenase [NADP(+)] [Venturia inaequalis]